MEKKEAALRYFRAGYNCAQSVILACAGERDDLTRAAAAFGGGMGRLQKTCGAVTGAYIFFGLNWASPGLPGEEDKLKVYERVRSFNRLFRERNGTDLCSELLGEDLNTDEGRARIKELRLTERVCEKCITDAIEIIEGLG